MRSQFHAFHKGLIAVLVTLALAGGGFAIAQEDTGESGDAAGDAGGDVGVTRRADLTGPEQVEAAEAILARGTQMARRVSVMLDEANQEADIVRHTCLDDKLSQLNANIRSLEARVESLRNAVAANDEGRRNHEYTVATVLGQNFQVLQQEANQCIGQDMFDTGSTRVETQIQEGSPDEDIRDLPDAPRLPIPYIPPPASGVI